MARGDHIKVSRWHGLWHHHGIDLGDGKVVHYSEPKDQLWKRESTGSPADEPKGKGIVVISSMEVFLGGGKKKVVKHWWRKALPVEETVRRALSHVGCGGYNVCFNNCEHFATWCKTGKKKSWQVIKAAGIFGFVVVVTTLRELSKESKSSA